MKSIVCVKRVPDTETRIRISGDQSSIETAGVKYVLNPYDEFALEAALKQKEGAGEGQVTVVTAGGSESADVLRTALAMGADDAVLLRTDAGVEGLGVARLLADEIRDRPFDLLLFGVKAVDDDLQAVGPMVAELLDLPAATSVTEFEVVDGKVTAQREIEGGVEVLELRIPCALTMTKGAYKPRSASLKGIMAAKKKTIEDKQVEAPTAGVKVGELSYPPERSAGRILGEGPDAVPELLRVLREEAKVI